jgi:DNA ligase-1
VAQAAVDLPGELILDGELLAFRDGRVRPFQELQRRLGRKRPPAALLTAVPVILVAWDLLHQDGESLLELPLRERRQRLEALQLGGAFATAHLEEAQGTADVDRLFTAARERGNEGLMTKNPDSPYLPGRRGLHWLKLKRPFDTLDVVVTGAELGHGKRREVLSDVTFAVRDESGELVTLGKAYTGLTDAEIAEMTALLQELTVSHHGRFRAVQPRIVLEVAFDSVQPSSRHRSGYALRFPRIVRWRRDRDAASADTLERVAQLAELRAASFEQRVDRAAEASSGA